MFLTTDAPAVRPYHLLALAKPGINLWLGLLGFLCGLYGSVAGLHEIRGFVHFFMRKTQFHTVLMRVCLHLTAPKKRPNLPVQER